MASMKVLVIAANGLNLGYLGCYGNEWVQTPNLDRLAAEGVVFDSHFADNPDASAARRTWLTGIYQIPFPGERETSQLSQNLVGLLTAQGLTTALLLDNDSSMHGDFAESWQHVVRIDHEADNDQTPLELTVASVGNVLDRLTSEDGWLLWIDLTTLLPPWELTAEYQELYFREDALEEGEDNDQDGGDETVLQLAPWGKVLPVRLDPNDNATFVRIQRTYAGMVTFLDDGIGALVEDLARRQLLDEMLVLITSDHGQVLDRLAIDQPDLPHLHEELIHVPFIVRLPKAAEAGRRVPHITQAVDLLPTLHEAFGLTAPAVPGRSLLSLCRGEHVVGNEFACSGLRSGNEFEWSLRTLDWRLVLPIGSGANDFAREPRLYVKPDDRLEVNNVCLHHPELAQQLEMKLRDGMKSVSDRDIARLSEMRRLGLNISVRTGGIQT
jgi:arylsulfatase A-like enzyme